MFWFLIAACIVQPDFEKLDKCQKKRKSKKSSVNNINGDGNKVAETKKDSNNDVIMTDSNELQSIQNHVANETPKKESIIEKLFITVEVIQLPPNKIFKVFTTVESAHWYKRLVGLKDYYPLQIVALNSKND